MTNATKLCKITAKRSEDSEGGDCNAADVGSNRNRSGRSQGNRHRLAGTLPYTGTDISLRTKDVNTLKRIFKGLTALAICGALNFGLTTEAQAADAEFINSNGTEYNEVSKRHRLPPPPDYWDDDDWDDDRYRQPPPPPPPRYGAPPPGWGTPPPPPPPPPPHW